jgi:phosphate transport system ATP-binding protein
VKQLVCDVKNLSLKRDGKFLLQGITFSLHSMEILSVIGAERAGKGLLFKTLMGIQQGEITGEVKSSGRMALVSRTYPCVEAFTVFQNLSLVAKFAGVDSQTHLAEEIEEVLKKVGLWSELKSQLHENVSQLSDFQKIRLDLARSLLLKPSVLLLDKPTLDIDPEKKALYESTIEKLKNSMAIIWVNHDLEQASRVSDKILYLKEGRMIEFGSCEDIFTMPLNPETENFISRRVYV